jgi:hypothetical protein
MRSGEHLLPTAHYYQTSSTFRVGDFCYKNNNSPAILYHTGTAKHSPFKGIMSPVEMKNEKMKSIIFLRCANGFKILSS